MTPSERTRKYQLRHKELGLCVSCTKPSIPGLTKCEKHHQHQLLRNKSEKGKECTKRYLLTPDGKISARNARYKYRYGITLEQYNILLSNQQGHCATCLSTGDNGIRLCVDHDHNTGKVRGLLCKKCNLAVGLLKDEPIVAFNISKYLSSGDNNVNREAL
jgi:hypothetical protein